MDLARLPVASSACSLDEDDDDDEEFLTECEKTAKEFVSLYFDSRTTAFVSKGPLRTLSGVGGDQLVVHDPVALAAAQRIRSVGDQVHAAVDGELNTILARQSVFEMGLPQFTTMCRAVLARCSGTINNGWQQVYAVYYGMAKVTNELRQQPNLPESVRKQREAHIQRFVGPTMQDIGLDDWIKMQGGLKQEFQATDTKVAIV